MMQSQLRRIQTWIEVERVLSQKVGKSQVQRGDRLNKSCLQCKSIRNDTKCRIHRLRYRQGGSV